MKKTTKITSLIIIFFLIIAAIIVGRQMMASHFKKKFSKKPPPGIIVAVVKNKKFSNKIESFGTALSKKTTSFRIKKEELLKQFFLEDKLLTKKAEKKLMLFRVLSLHRISYMSQLLAANSWSIQFLMAN